MIFPKVVIATPTYDKKNYCFDLWYEQIQKLTYPNKVLFVVDNSQTKDNYKKLSKLGIKTHYINPHNKSTKQVIAESFEMCRQFALGSKADFMCTWESDIFNNDPTIIEQLMMQKKPIINTVYPIRTGQDRELCITLVSGTDNMLHEHRDIVYVRDNYVNFIDGTVKECYSCGLGLCLIHSSILKRVKFRYLKDEPMLPDLLFADDLFNMGITNYVHTGIFSDHENIEWEAKK